ncbi:unnamed protein product, partial [Prorocentrum cordatum]
WLRADGRRSRRRVLARALRSRAMSDHGGARADCPRGIGASLLWPDVPEHLLGPHPVVYSFAIPVAGVCLIATSLISAPHLWRLSAPDAAGAKMALRVRQVRTVAAVPLTIVAFKFAAMVAPRIWKLLFLLAAGYEVFAFWTLVQLLLGMVAPSFDEAVQELAALSDTKMWSVPPVACCFRPFATPQPPRREDLLIIRCLVWQFIIFVPAIAAAEMAEELPERLHNILPKLETLSLVTAMYGIFALLEATHEVLIERRTHAKFWVVKGTFIANLASFRLACAFVRSDVRVGNMCYTSETIATAWSGLFAAVMSVPLALLSTYAYPQDDLIDKAKFGEGDSLFKAM